MTINNKITSNIPLVLLMVLVFSLTNALAVKSQMKSTVHSPSEQRVDQIEDKRIEMTSENLPAKISEDLITNYKDARIIKSWKWINDGGEILKYEVQLDKQGEDLHLEYDTEGKPITLKREKK